MILQALYEYYQRKLAINQIDPPGFITKEIDFIIIIDFEGNYIDFENLQIQKAKKLRGTPFRVPLIGKQALKHDNSGIDSNLLWDKADFVLGVGNNGKSKVNSFIQVINDYYPNPPNDVESILKFYNKELSKEYPFKQILENHEIAEQVKKGTITLTFRVNGNRNLIINESHVEEAIKNKRQDNIKFGTCLITGETNIPIENTHMVTKGIIGSQSSGANLISFNKPSFLSYHKEQSENAPVSKQAAESYTKALQNLVDSEHNKVKIADATIVFWSEKESEEINPEEIFPWVISGFSKNEDDPDRGVEVIKKLYDAIYNGKLPRERDKRFYILGLAPNSGRIAVRFWRVVSVDDFASHIKQHFDDFKIIHGPKEQEYLSLLQILASTALSYKMENVPPNLAGKVIESIIDGTPYPNTLLQQCIRRIRAEQNVNRARAGILKAYLNRFNKIYNKSEREITMSLDTQNKNIGYRLGRLFAVLEKIQEEANPGINTTIKDRFYGAASSSPTAVFSQLLKLKNHHTPKLQPGRKIYFEKLITEIMSEINSFPGNLSLNDQAYFGIGYYHQRQDFFTSKSDKSDNNNQQ